MPNVVPPAQLKDKWQESFMTTTKHLNIINNIGMPMLPSSPPPPPVISNKFYRCVTLLATLSVDSPGYES